jgi:calmodulin/calcium-binding protein CML
MSKHSSFSLHFLSNQKRQELQDMFKAFDKDHDDKISAAELRNMLGSTGIDEQQMNSVVRTLIFNSTLLLTFL